MKFKELGKITFNLDEKELLKLNIKKSDCLLKTQVYAKIFN